jgi:hypothetical protein
METIRGACPEAGAKGQTRLNVGIQAEYSTLDLNFQSTVSPKLIALFGYGLSVPRRSCQTVSAFLLILFLFPLR